ncbi:MAG: hypothetical protein Q9162_003299 [Coniocarpon cinnabarinum]
MVKAVATSDLEVQITVNDDLCEEYDDKDAEDSPSHITRYIEVREGFSWAVRATLGPILKRSEYTLSLSVNVDGKGLYHECIFQPELKAKTASTLPMASSIHTISRFPYNADGKTFWSDFSFKRVKTTEDRVEPRHRALLPEAVNAGCIELQLYQSTETKLAQPQPLYYAKPTLLPDNVPEKILKGRVTTDSLKALMVIPEAPMVIPETPRSSPILREDEAESEDGVKDEDLDKLSADQLRNRLRRLRTSHNPKKRELSNETIKQEDETTANLSQMSDVQFAFSRPVKRVNVEAGEIIDLSRDD